MKAFTKYFLTIFIIGFLFSCEKEKEKENTDTLVVNEWISDIMNTYYYWYKDMPENTPDNATNPEDYFYSLLNQEDLWSFITDDFATLMASFEGVSTTNGITPSLISFEGSNQVAILVLYVYKNSPAYNAGVRRGDWIIEIDGIELTENNFQDLYEQESLTATMAVYENWEVVETGTVELENVVLDVDPVIFDTVYEQEGKRIGYLYLSEFTYPENFKANVGAAFNRMGTNLDHLIVDLRYNGGGSLASALWLASSLAPKSVVDNHGLLVELLYNDILEAGMSSSDKNHYLDATAFSYDFQEITFLANHSSASASELIIMGLEPFMEVDHIGSNTYGKYTASIPFDDDDNQETHNYGIFPIVAKYANSDGFTDFKEGLEPDFKKEETLNDIRPLGNTEDLLIASAIYRITGSYPTTAKSQTIINGRDIPFKMVPNSPLNKKRKDLIIN